MAGKPQGISAKAAKAFDRQQAERDSNEAAGVQDNEGEGFGELANGSPPPAEKADEKPAEEPKPQPPKEDPDPRQRTETRSPTELLVPDWLAEKVPLLRAHLVPLALLGLVRATHPLSRELEGKLCVKDTLRMVAGWAGGRGAELVANAIVACDPSRYQLVVKQLALPEIEAELYVAEHEERERQKKTAPRVPERQAG